MNILVAYYSKSGNTEKVAKKIAESLQAKAHGVRLFKVMPVEELKAGQYSKTEKDLPLREPLVNLQKFDLVVVGTPVWGFSPTPIITSYLRQMEGAKGKSFALFCACSVIPGTTIKRMSSIISTKGGTVLDSLVIKSLFEFDEKKLKEAKCFAEKIAGSA
ncbi:MAG: flavodoxin family protein [Candidatus Diapherotrites archaeon]|nr:flavodoxin family protein [Candidatus Diapherotrites archaeon]